MLYPAELRARAGASIRGRDRRTQPPYARDGSRHCFVRRPPLDRSNAQYRRTCLTAAGRRLLVHHGERSPALPRARRKRSIRACQFRTRHRPGRSTRRLPSALQALVETARAGVPQFDAQESEATRLAAAAGPVSSESWIAAQQALSRLVEQHGVTTRAAGDIDALAANRLDGQHWIRPADQQAIAAAAAEVASINGPSRKPSGGSPANWRASWSPVVARRAIRPRRWNRRWSG